ncbi:MAG: hypothetical protein DI535_06285 [Citrobacter freundii]|nr:MAG: hypothetical protein DI535_06285 [Citrobacter freundii]
MDRLQKLKEFLEKDPRDSFLRHALALEYIKLGDDAAAKKEFEDLLTQNPAYVGSYYHLGKLLERNGDTNAAIAVYEQGMVQAKAAGDMHAHGELRGAHEELTF